VKYVLTTCCLLILYVSSPCTDSAGSQEVSTATTKKKPSTDAPSDEAISKLIQQLGSAEFAEREAATKRLQSIGEAALPALREAAKDNDNPEIQRRAQRLIERIAPTPDLLEEILREARQFEQSKDYRKAAASLEKAFDIAKARYHPAGALVTDVPKLTEIALRLARVRKHLGEYELAGRSFHLASYYSNENDQKRKEIGDEWLNMTKHLLAGWGKTVQKKVETNSTLKALASKYPLILLHTRRFAGDRYFNSTYSFLYETADESKHFNDVQLQFDNGAAKNTFGVNMVNGQENRVADLANVDFTKDPDPAKIGIDEETKWSSDETQAQEGHVYLEEIKDSNGNHFFVVFQIVATDKDSRFLAFIWRKLPGGTVVKRP
jgi:tetratricopeptide (TPR) repeat protein